jgi:hypothetical protein
MQQLDARAFAFFLADVHGRAGRQAGLARALLHESGHAFSFGISGFEAAGF